MKRLDLKLKKNNSKKQLDEKLAAGCHGICFCNSFLISKTDVVLLMTIAY